MDQVEIIIIGAGVIGLALARELAGRGHEVLIVEAESAIGSITSSRNSGVIHAGLYYRPGGLKARACTAGRDKLYAYAALRKIPHVRCGKLVVATAPEQIESLLKLKANAEANNVPGLRLLEADEARKMEPELACLKALHVPVTGLIDVHELMHALLADAETGGAMLALHAPVVAGDVSHEEHHVLSIGGANPMQIACSRLINAAGLNAQAVARALHGLNPATIPPQVLAKGNYFTLSGPKPFERLIYPLPVPGSLGLHYSYDFGGQTRFGPDVEWIDQIDYQVDPSRAALFEESIAQYWPNLPRGKLQPGYAGIRPKLSRASPHDSEFVIQTHRDHGIANLINLYGIESPGLTSSLALAEIIAEHLSEGYA